MFMIIKYKMFPTNNNTICTSNSQYSFLQSEKSLLYRILDNITL